MAVRDRMVTNSESQLGVKSWSKSGCRLKELWSRQPSGRLHLVATTLM
jgi:hypothetical protein